MKYYIRLDDASDHMNIEAWSRIENLLNKYRIKPLFGIIPNNKDSILCDQYEQDPAFWDKMARWIENGWMPALHGYDHRLISKCRGINPINPNSEFAGVPIEEQKLKIHGGIEILNQHGIEPTIFFAPGHTYDMNTLTALREESNIRIISDTMTNDVYKKYGFYFIPAQSGRPRKMRFCCSTICLHPNTMSESAFAKLEAFLAEHHEEFGNFSEIELKDRKMSLYDKLIQNLYYLKRKRVK